jgi:putative nucleotidyltransferase with HDIG domain
MTIAFLAAPLRLPGTLDPSLRRLLAAVHAATPTTYLVGGAIRDLLRGAQPVDLDIVVAGDAHQVAENLAAALGGHLFALDEARGQFRIVLDEGDVQEIDLSPLAGMIEDDLARRDFTVNAMAAPITPEGTLGEVIDPFGGSNDLTSKLLHAVSEQALVEDPLRLLRAVRFAVELDFEIEPDTAAALKRLAPCIHEAAAERQQAELMRIFATPRASMGMRLLDSLDLLAELLPEVTAGRGVLQPVTHHYWDVFDHSIETLANLDVLLDGRGPSSDSSLESLRMRGMEDAWFQRELRDQLAWFAPAAYLDEKSGGYSRRVLLKLAGLLHDVGKPETKAVEADGRTHFFGHCELGAAKAKAICRRLRLGNRETEFVSLLVEEHLRPTQLSDRPSPPSQRALYRFRRDLGDAAPACLLLMLADGAAAVGPPLKHERWQRRVAYVGYVLQQLEAQSQAAATAPRLVTGHDLMAALGLEPGPELGRILDAVNEAIGAGEITSREAAIEYAMRTSPPNPLSVHGEGVAAAGGEVSQTLRNWQTPGNLWERLKPRAREMRHAPTDAEERLWQALRRKALGVQFRRQHPLGRFVVDFYTSTAKLVIEVDGSIHERTAEQDAMRTELLEAQGLQILRFSNEDVLANLPAVLNKIRVALGEGARS